MICQLVDDSAFDDFLLSPAVGLDKKQRDAGLRLLCAINEFCEATPAILDPAVVINDARWAEIRRLASEFLTVLGERS